MNTDPVLQEVRRAKEAVAAKYGYDIRKLVLDMIQRQHEAGTKAIKLPPRKHQLA